MEITELIIKTQVPGKLKPKHRFNFWQRLRNLLVQKRESGNKTNEDKAQ